MARPGRRPKPIEAHARDGTRPKAPADAAATPNLVAGRERPDTPPGLDAEMKRVWEIVCDDLEEGRVLDKADWSVVEAFVVTIVRARQARRAMVKEAKRQSADDEDGMETYGGLLAAGQKSAAVISPLLSIERTAWKDAVSYADALGLGPSGRARLGISKRKPGAQQGGRSINDDAARRGVPDSPRARRAGLGVVAGGRGA